MKEVRFGELPYLKFEGMVLSCAFSPDEKTFAVGLQSVFSPCGQTIATSSYDMTTRLWNANSGDLVRVYDDHPNDLMNLQFSPNGQQILEITEEGVIIIWEIDTGVRREFKIGRDPKESFSFVKFSPISLQLSTSESAHNTISIWDQSSSEPRYNLKHDSVVNGFAWSYCEQWIAARCSNIVYLWKKSSENFIEWTCAMFIHDLHEDVCSLDWRPNTLEFVTTCEDRSIRVWRLVETTGVWSVQLIWSTGGSTLVASEAKFSSTIGLSVVNQQLLKQRN
ncbi:hypothetical protein FBU30_002028 [Linnemannia zychae]|nr:hypothetical protein FBU30_002028 [Linnemannia zychae]